jgi:hypothetical protein
MMVHADAQVRPGFGAEANGRRFLQELTTREELTERQLTHMSRAPAFCEFGWLVR